MWKYNFIIIFIKFNIKFIVVKVDYACFANKKYRYQLIVDFLIYIIFETRLNIAYIISIINRYVFNSNKSHWKIVKQIFWYFRHSLNFCFTFINAFQLLKNYIDVDWVSNYNICCFTFNYVFNLKNVVISWFSKRQFTITLSIYKIEYINQTQTIKKVI